MVLKSAVPISRFDKPSSVPPPTDVPLTHSYSSYELILIILTPDPILTNILGKLAASSFSVTFHVPSS